jgi:transcription elongation regulator 1
VSRLRAKNARDVAVERFKTLLAESEKKWNLAESAPPGFDDAKQILFADAQRRAAVVAGAFEEDDMRALFEAHVSSAIHARVVDVTALLDEKLVARSAKDFLEEEEEEEDDDEEKEKTNPLVSFVAAQNFAPLISDPRWDRCPVEQRAAAYVRRVETLCLELNAETVPEDVAELRDALAEARAKRLEKRGDGAEDGECDATG